MGYMGKYDGFIPTFYIIVNMNLSQLLEGAIGELPILLYSTVCSLQQAVDSK
jgi:hypothetical protein